MHPAQSTLRLAGGCIKTSAAAAPAIMGPLRFVGAGECALQVAAGCDDRVDYHCTCSGVGAVGQTTMDSTRFTSGTLPAAAPILRCHARPRASRFARISSRLAPPTRRSESDGPSTRVHARSRTRAALTLRLPLRLTATQAVRVGRHRPDRGRGPNAPAPNADWGEGCWFGAPELGLRGASTRHRAAGRRAFPWSSSRASRHDCDSGLRDR